ncbi:MAG: NAD-dependent epimerase/dehydratase family protein [Chloroflexi bacterium]|nr:NAD-dependent epimerase/dehydratase family protein [Chloroflexota bacterium]MCL5026621.1 NAD-dependent epimerase/dehydratase family protein [Chloroflexota bacterium]
MRIVVTGGTGFIGSHLTRELSVRGHEVYTLSRAARGPASAAAHGQFSVQNPRAREFAEQGDAIVHLAGLADASSSLNLPYAYAHLHSEGTLNMLEAARYRKIPFLLVSSQRVYGPRAGLLAEDAPKQPVEPYGYSKLIAEKWVEMYRQLYQLPGIITRLFSVYGPGQTVVGGTSGVVSILMRRALAGEEMIVRSKVCRDFTYVGDAVNGIIQALTMPARPSHVYNIATGRGTSLQELAELVRKVTRSSSRIRVEEGDAEDQFVADIGRATRELGYCPQVDLIHGLTEYARWWKNAT